MHIAPGFLSPAVAAGCGAVAAGAVAAAAVWARKTLDERLVPVVGVMGAFVFAAQMLNFPICLGASGHLVGGFLLGLLCGWAPALLSMTAILALQALVFTDGGLDALGANLINMGLLSTLLGAAARLVWQRRGLAWAMRFSVVGAWLAVMLGAVLAVAEFWLSGRLNTPELFWLMAAPMVGFHALGGVVEGLATAAVLAFVARSEIAVRLNRPEAAA